MLLFSRPGLQRRIILLVAFGMFVMLAALGISSFLAVEESVERALEERLVLAQVTADHLEYVLRQNLSRLENIAFSKGVNLEDGDIEPERDALHDAYLHSIFSGGVFLLDAQGNMLLLEPYRSQMRGDNLYDYPHVRQALKEGKPVVSNVFIIEPAGKPVVSVVTPLKNREGKIVGVVGGYIDLTTHGLSEVIQPVRLGETGYVEIVDGRGVVLCGTEPEHILRESDHRNQLADLIRDRKTTIGTCHSCHDVAQEQQKRTEVMAFAPLSTVSWGVSIRQSEAEALTPARKMQQRFIIIGVSIVAVALVLAWGTARSVVKPLGMLTAAARRIATGNLADPIPSMGRDEIGLLSQSLEEMRAKLKSSYEELDKLNKELEERVKHRTKELLALVQGAQNLAMFALNLDSLLQTITKTAMETLDGADAAALFLYNRELDKLVVRYAIGYDMEAITKVKLNPGEYIVGKAFASGEAILCSTPEEFSAVVSDAIPENRDSLARAWGGAQPQSAVCVPLQSKDRAIGSLVLVSLHQRAAFSPADQQLLSAFAAHAAVAIENATLYEEIQRKETMRGELLRKVISAQEEERKRIARELHDDTSQALAALVMTLDTTAVVPSTDDEQLKGKLATIRTLAVDVLDGLHRMIFDLRPSVLDDLGLLAALRWYAESRLESQGVKVRLEISGAERRMPTEVETALFRVVQEATTNISKHAEADNVLISVGFEDSAITIEVEDDGKGFDVEKLSESPRKVMGLGLMGMKERVSLLGGTFSIKSHPGGGTRVTIEVPLSPEEVRNEQNKGANRR